MSAGDTARMAFQCARDEMMERLRMREKLSMFYLTGNMLAIFLSAMTGLAESKEVPLFQKVVLTGIMPCISLIIALAIAHHVKVTELLANLIRHDINNHLIALGEWSPHWELTLSKIEAKKSRGTRNTQIFRLHLPTLLSLVLCWYYCRRFVRGSQDMEASQIAVGICMPAYMLFVIAVCVTWQSYGIRFERACKHGKTPPGYDPKPIVAISTEGH